MSFPPSKGAPRRRANRLAGEKSPYLLQHAHNPVDWHPWGDEAIARAQREDKPIFLSIGYSTCHWCHVMERESFENEDIAAFLNANFIPIKVDREERPDLDQIYMTATQAMSGGGGWPMSVWLNPRLEPFFCGTYFPPDDRGGRPGFLEMLRRIHRAWGQSRGKLDEQAARLAGAVRALVDEGDAPAAARVSLPAAAYRHFSDSFDAAFGGFGGAPKFPRPVQFSFLFRYHAATGDRRALEMAALTLERMAHGGICDQLGGGFHRYSVDEEWRTPHFEKMLFDNAQLLVVYREAWQLTRQPLFEEVARGIAGYVARDMTSAEGAFFSAEDADSEGCEGAFYVWRLEELRRLLGVADTEIVAARYGCTEEGNFEPGRNVLHPAEDAEIVAGRLKISPEELRRAVERAKPKLLDARARRPRPLRDDKVLVAWNGLMISGLATAGRAFGERDFVARAARAAEFLLANLRDSATGHLLRRWREGEARGAAFLDDYAFFVAGLLDLYEASGEKRWLTEAERLTAEQREAFWDAKRGGYFLVRGDDPSLLIRPKSDYEGAEPSGNSVAALNLLRLAGLTGDDAHRTRAEETLRAFGPRLERFPPSMPLMIAAHMDFLAPPRQVAVAVGADPEKAEALWREVNRHFLPHTALFGPGAARPPKLAGMGPVEGKSAVHICRGFTCRAPVLDCAGLSAALAGKLDAPQASETGAARAPSSGA
ncbi:MAG: thioredoxin domain-containing protein [Verrucomicrobiae bacterium]|nr:thioredoxin domain-containing protein [Verrucomicrobiae bacterium]